METPDALNIFRVCDVLMGLKCVVLTDAEVPLATGRLKEVVAICKKCVCECM